MGNEAKRASQFFFPESACKETGRATDLCVRCTLIACEFRWPKHHRPVSIKRQVITYDKYGNYPRFCDHPLTHCLVILICEKQEFYRLCVRFVYRLP